MSDPDYLQNGFDKILSHAIEECGEFLNAVGKFQRWGGHSSNPIYAKAPDGSCGECNAHWLYREIRDVRQAMYRLEASIREEFDARFFDQDIDGNWINS